MWSKKFWKASATRTVRTGAQVLLGFVVVDVAVWDIDWSQATGVTATAMLASVLMSISGPAGPDKATGDSGVPDPHEEYVGKRRRDPAWGEVDGEE